MFVYTFTEFRVWYRHTNQSEVDHRDLPSLHWNSLSKSEREVLDDVGQHIITHLAISKDGLPSLSVIASKVTHLKLEDITSTTDLEW